MFGKEIKMKIMCIGDVVSRTGREMLFRYIADYRQNHGVDFVIANGENATHGRGLAYPAYNEIMRAGVDVLTLGNHAWGAKDVVQIMERKKNVIRPANFSSRCPGPGSLVMRTKSGTKVGIINLIGRTFMPQQVDSPFDAADREIEKLKGKTNIIIVDFHAEATSEKLAMFYHLDGRVSAVFGTHTHVQTADETVSASGTGYITDIGMTGPGDSVLGMDKTIITNRFLTELPQKFEVAVGNGIFCACIFEVDEETGKCAGVERVYLRE